MSNPWKKISEPVNVRKLTDIMSEECAKVRQNREHLKFAAHISDSNITSTSVEVSSETLQQIEKSNVDGNSNSGNTIEKNLQCQFDEENDDDLKLFKEKGSGKVVVVREFFNNYRDGPEYFIDESDFKEDLYTERKDVNRLETNDTTFANFLKRCIITNDGRMVTKFESDITGKRSATHITAIEGEPPELCSEDDPRFDVKLSNPVFNQLNEHTMWNQACMPKTFNHKKSQLPKYTADLGLDEATRLNLFKLINNGMLLDINEVIATGKKSIILHANSNPLFTEKVLPKECAIKVFKIILNDFRVRNKYIKAKHRFRYNFSEPVNKVLQMWAEKEMQHMMTIQKVGLNCPEIVCLKKHILVMSFIGKDNKPAPKLRDVVLELDKWKSIYYGIMDGMHKLYNVGHLILRDYKILWWENRCWYVGVAQSIQTSHPDAFSILYENCYNIGHFFMDKGVIDNMSAIDEVFKSITGLKRIYREVEDADLSNKSLPF